MQFNSWKFYIFHNTLQLNWHKYMQRSERLCPRNVGKKFFSYATELDVRAFSCFSTLSSYRCIYEYIHTYMYANVYVCICARRFVPLVCFKSKFTLTAPIQNKLNVISNRIVLNTHTLVHTYTRINIYITKLI